MSALKEVFSRVHFRYDNDPNVEDLEQFAAWLSARGYCNKPARTHLYNVQQVLRQLAVAPGSKLNADELAVAFRRSGPAWLRYQHTHSTFAQFLRVHNRLIEARQRERDRFKDLRRAFCDQLERRRGLRPCTIHQYDYWIGDFLQRSLGRSTPLKSLTSATFEAYVKARQPELASSTLVNAIGCVRDFLQYCLEQKLLTTRVDILDRPAALSDDKPPRALPWPLIQKFLRSIDRGDWVGRRDYLILHLMAHYGLRPGEVGLLTVDAIDWTGRTLTVNQAKTSSTLVLPVDDRTLRLMRCYLENDRRKSSLPWVFLKAKAPEGPMNKCVVSQMFKIRARRSGLPIAQCSSYSLRHSFAMRLFGRGVGVKAISDLMGHRSLVSTGIYLRLQTDALRNLALPMPATRSWKGGAA